MKQHVLSLAVAFGVFSADQTIYAQGSLTPPGPPTPTFRTLQQIEPRTPISSVPATITTSGSYYLTTNLTCSGCGGGTNGVTITADNVTVDLNGFEFNGVAGSGTGVKGPSSQPNTCVRNGALRGWGGNGVDLSQSVNSQIEGLRVDVSGDGVLVSGNSLVTGCTVSQSPGRTGIVATAESLVRDCAVNVSASTGLGIHAGQGAFIHRCKINTQGADAILANLGNYILENQCYGLNAGVGIRLTGADNRVDGNNVKNYGTGIRAEAGGNLIIRNSVTGSLTNYFFSGTQSFGPTNLVTGVVTNHPWANLSF